jgi:hypothetical protein
MANDQGSKAGDKPVKDTQDTPAEESTSDTPNPSESGDTQADASRKAQQLGESRKKAFATLINLAKTSDEAKQELAKISEDEYNRTYMEEKFGEDYTSLFKEKETTSDDIVEKVEKLSREREVEKQNKLRSAKASIGITLDQEDEFNDLVTNLEGASIGGKTVTFEEAVERAASQMRPGKKVSFSKKSDVSNRPEDKKDEVKVSLTDKQISRSHMYTKATSKDDFVEIQEQFQKKGSYSINPYNS